MREHKKSHLGIMGWAIYLAGAMSLGSCSTDETIESMEPTAITFGSVSMENHSRAVDPSYGQSKLIDNFQVWGTVKGNTNNTIKIFDGATVTRGTAAYGAAWECSETQYWIPGADYEFLAIVDGNKQGVTETKLATTEPYMPESITYTADGVTDLLCQNVSRPQNSDESVVAFQFTHLLSKVHFTFESEFQNVNVTDIQITGHYASGTYNIGTKSWTPGSVSTSHISFGDALGITPANPVTSTDAQLIIPGDNQTLTISFEKDGKVIAEADRPTITHNFVANTEYNILVTFEGGEITFTISSLEQWDNGDTEQEIPLNP